MKSLMEGPQTRAGEYVHPEVMLVKMKMKTMLRR